MRVLGNREERLDKLLTHYTEARETLQLGDGPGDSGGDSKLLLMPRTWNSSYRVLEGLLVYMRHLADSPGESSPGFRSRYFHLCEWYLRAEKRRAPVMRRDKKNREYQVTTANGPQFEIKTIRKGNPALVLLALEWLDGHFPGEIDLPDDLREKERAAA